jgi:hypothetical protein
LANPKENPCRNGCGKSVHFNRNNPQGFQNDGTPKGKWTPLEYGPQGEVVHNCPNRQNYQGGQAAPAAGGQPQTPPSAPQNTGPSVTQLLLAEQQKTNVLLAGILAEVSVQAGILKKIHPDLAEPQKPLPPETAEPTPADELPEQ